MDERDGTDEAGTGVARQVRLLARRYCRARLGRSRAGWTAADDLAARVAAAILRDRRDELHGPRPWEAVVYPDLAAAVQRAVGTSSTSSTSSEPGTGRHPWSHTPPTGPIPLAAGDPAADPAADPVQRRLDGLPQRTREVLVLRALVGLSSEQVGRALGLSPEAVAVEQQRALSLLRRA